ncbi:MAG: YceI family protein [Caldilineaceae bacterium]
MWLLRSSHDLTCLNRMRRYVGYRLVIAPAETTVGYAIQEVFIPDQNALATAIGATNEVQGALLLNHADPAASEFDPFVVDISTLKSDRSSRDRAICAMWLESSKVPLVTFEVAEVRGFPENPDEGVPISFQLAGDFTVREITRNVVWDVTASLEDEQLTVSATLGTMLADFDIPMSSMANILRVTDGITLTLDFVTERTTPPIV